MHITLPSIFRICIVCVQSPPFDQVAAAARKTKSLLLFCIFCYFTTYSILTSRSRRSACLGVRGLGQAANITVCEAKSAYRKVKRY